MAVCNICLNNTFGAGPGGRMSVTGLPPRCEKCQSLERHRIYRKVFQQLVDESFKARSFLQFSPDRTADPDWFASYEVSTYGGDNSLDLQKIEKESNSYDIVMCNHVLEHVPYDNSALNELLRIIKHDGFIFLTVPSPFSQERTRDWGYAKQEDHGHYRVYGKDFSSMLKRYLPNAWIASKTDIDDSTNTQDIIFFIGHTKNGIEVILNNLESVEIIQSGK